jgi:hypothetical protein
VNGGFNQLELRDFTLIADLTAAVQDAPEVQAGNVFHAL